MEALKNLLQLEPYNKPHSLTHSLTLSSPLLGFLFNSIWPFFVSLVKCPDGQQRDVQPANRLRREDGGGKTERERETQMEKETNQGCTG